METFLGKSETFWVGVQALAAVLGLLGLFLYVVYTRRMMKLQSQALTATYTPQLSVAQAEIKPATELLYGTDNRPISDAAGQVIESAIKGHYSMRLEVWNIGQGPLTGVSAWWRPVTNSFRFVGEDVYPHDGKCIDAVASRLQMERDANFSFFWTPISSMLPALLVIEGVDVAGGKHQLQILMTPKLEAGQSSGEIMQELQMVHASGESFGERIVSYVSRFVNVINHIKKVLRRIRLPD